MLTLQNVQRRDIQKNQKVDFIIEKLVQHTQALEHLLEIIENSEQMLKKIVEFFSRKLEQPQMPEKIEVPTLSRRSYVENDDPELPIVKFGENIRRYGSLMKNLILKEIKNEPEPIVYIEQDIPKTKTNKI